MRHPVSSRAGLVCAGSVFLAALLLYIRTLAPTVTPTDSGELIVVAHGLGVAHPPGVPLWVMLAHLASLVPLGNVAVRINLSSALFAALASAMLTLVVAELIITASYLPKTKQRGARKKTKTADSAVDPVLIFAPAVGAGLVMAFSRTLWSYATIAEVYTLNTLLILTVFFLMLRWRRRIVADQTNISSPITIHDSWLYAAALVFGLALGVHHVTVGLTLPAVGVLVYRTEGLRFFTSRRLLYAALISIGGLVAVYAYLPFAAWRSPVINWGNPRSLQEIWWHITGRQYRVFLTFSPSMMGTQFVEFCRMLLREFGPAWLPLSLVLAFAGLRSAFRQDRTSFWFLFFIVMADLAYALSYEIAEDKDAYYLPTFISIAIAAGFGIRWLIQLSASKAIALQKTYGSRQLLFYSYRRQRSRRIGRSTIAGTTLSRTIMSKICSARSSQTGCYLHKIGRSPPQCFMNRRWNDAGPTSKLSISICCVARGTSIISNTLIPVWSSGRATRLRHMLRTSKNGSAIPGLSPGASRSLKRLAWLFRKWFGQS